MTRSSSARRIHGKLASLFKKWASQPSSGGFHFRTVTTVTTVTASAISIRTGTRAGAASGTPVHLMPIPPHLTSTPPQVTAIPLTSRPSVSDASGLLPAQAIAHTAITLASRRGPALVASCVRVAELAIRHITPAPNAAEKQPHTQGDRTKAIMHTARAASALAVSRTEGVYKDGR